MREVGVNPRDLSGLSRGAAQARIEIEPLRTTDLELPEGRMQGIDQDIARPGQHHAGDDQGQDTMRVPGEFHRPP
jgi:hypothetical protein